MLWHPKTFQSSASCNVFFTFGRFSMAGSLPKWPKIRQNFTKMTQNDPKFHFHAFGSSDIQKSSENYENTTSIWTRCQNFVSVRHRFWAPPHGGELLGLFGAGVPMRCVPSKSSLHACSSSWQIETLYVVAKMVSLCHLGKPLAWYSVLLDLVFFSSEGYECDRASIYMSLQGW